MNPTSTSHNSLENKHFGFWGNLRLSFKLMLAFGVVFILALVIAAITLRGLNQVQASYEHALSQGSELQNLSDELQIRLLQARRAEKNFILRWQSEGFDTAYENYVTINPQDVSSTRGPTYLQNIEAMRELNKQLIPFGSVAETVSTGDMTSAQYEADMTSLGQAIDTYEKSFTAFVEASRKYGENENNGFLGEVRTIAHDMEARVSEKAGLESLVITLLEIRRYEKDYVARKDQVSIDNVHTLVAQFKAEVAASELLQSTEKNELKILTDQYQTSFDTLVAKDKELTQYNDAMVAAGRNVEALTVKIEVLGEQLARDDINTARTSSTQTFTFSIITVMIVLFTTIFISIALSRQITRPVISLTKTAEQIASGDFETQAEVASADEVGTLAQTFNAMTSRLRHAFEDVRRRALAVQTSAEVSRRLTIATNPRQLAVDVVEQIQSAFNYYHAHIYFFDEAGENLVMAGGTGEAGATMLARGHKIPKGRGLVGRAAATNTPVLVPDVSQEDGWLPNALLPDTKSEAAIPISSGKHVLGVLDVQQNIVNGLGQEDVELLQSLAGQVSISLQNARTFEESRAKAELESMVNTIGQKIQRASSVEDTLQTAIREIGLALGASRVSANIQASQRVDSDKSSRN